MSEKLAGEPEKSNAEDPAVVALKRLARPQPKPVEGPALPEEDSALSSGSATGFVGTLAHGGKGPQPGDSVAGGRALNPMEQLRMAREVPRQRPISPLSEIAGAAAHAEAAGAEPSVAEPPAKSTGHAGMAPFMFVLAVPLLIIGMWAVGALMYMQALKPMSPRDVTYPLIAWQVDLQSGGAYTHASVMMAWSMLFCLPVATLLLVMGWKLRKPRNDVDANDRLSSV